ncbi:MAG: 23S rRNA (adenine(2503)-C(2))-methyltransferase RlmN [Bacilli bacterium]
MNSIFNYTFDKFSLYLVENGFKKYNAQQIFQWIYKKKVYDFNMMTNLSKDLINFLVNNLSTKMLLVLKEDKTSLTSKYLLQVNDDTIECVLMKQNYGNSLCVSSQVGCNMSCAFCESGRLKKVRNLLTSEMILQILTIENINNIKIDNIVIMGIGEPFDNYDNVVDFINILIDSKAVTISQRKITVSTCGIVPKIILFANLRNQVNLAVSLHAPNDEIRNKLMPINKVYNVKTLFNCIDNYIEITNRRVTIEYILIDGVNDSEECAWELSSLVKNKLMYVNLIPYNTTSSFTFKRSKDFKIKKFYDILKMNKIEVIIRKEMGLKKSAACGQLRANSKE